MPTKLITLPTGNPAQAQALLTQTLQENKVLLIVIGSTNIAVNTADRAARFAGAPDEARWVVRAPVIEDVITILKTIKDPTPLVLDWDDTLLIAVSITDVIRDMIDQDGTLPTLVRLQTAWMKAENNQ
ncbi:MAG: hypothetical protein IPP15_13110 [Saprospiraceae bacterium]|uniref:Uncharacterized protein n=1 Tax=Candidatus Opimibacter skivensis TaxID=2982028 RepID=A0A9D7SYU3_9BACT|nr:hypothetical protein [Candidatus Opimibacter skivensis]